ncbi:MAG: hypothetical protein GY850_23755 [bacterium]|nr:hypothetical protein [bacterium]
MRNGRVMVNDDFSEWSCQSYMTYEDVTRVQSSSALPAAYPKQPFSAETPPANKTNDKSTPADLIINFIFIAITLLICDFFKHNTDHYSVRVAQTAI